MEKHSNPPTSDPDQLPQVLVLKPPPIFRFFLTELSRDFNFIKAYESPLPTDQFLSTHATDITALLASGFGLPITAQGVLRHLPSLKCIVTTSTGVNHIDLAECRRRGIAVANAGDVFSEDTSDTAVELLIDVLRMISSGDRYVRRGNWGVKGEYSLGRKLGGKKVGIVGLGAIGSKTAKRLEAFGCSILYNSRRKKPHVPYPYYSDVHGLAADSDILVLCCALTDETRHMINKEVLAALGKEGVIINVARGAVIDEKELVRCLVEGEIAGAGLDVFENEPYVPIELFELDNVILTPHQAVHTWESFRALNEQVTGNLKAFFANEPLLSPVENE